MPKKNNFEIKNFDKYMPNCELKIKKYLYRLVSKRADQEDYRKRFNFRLLCSTPQNSKSGNNREQLLQGTNFVELFRSYIH